ncbi:hypothetical protein J40TS1_38130 [Paenibacillus montaniterrae]|uniref:Uncharacterized protein n=1 Tax=Paenibacillus montaniterrae TaxID=429341 RepID=A0A920CYS7_9BACL|nr:hypothetical protein [Paenibacillus montaniterrae]GIP18171.1 hypothetical protein J40TS1_38130 [Paenibacillus montaniterrae]
MIKTYNIKVPRSNYLQIILFVFLLGNTIRLELLLDSSDSIILNLLVWLGISTALFVIIVKLYLLARFGKEIVITSDSIKTKNREVPIKDIEKIIVEGYFTQNIGIKRVGKKLVSSDLHFRFKKEEEKQVEEWTKWAEHNGIPVVEGRIIKWI